MDRNQVLFVDDEASRVEEYLHNLRTELAKLDIRVEFSNNVDDALQWLERHKEDVACIVADIMLPSGNKYDDSYTEAGLLTGLRFL